MLIAEVAIFLEAFADDFFELEREFGIEAERRGRFAAENFFEDDAGGFAREWQLAGGHFVEHDGEGEEIGARVEIFTANLFGRHVGDGAEGSAGTGEMFGITSDGREGVGIVTVLFCAALLGEAEVENFCVAAAGDENVGGFDVAMDDGGGVSGVESVGDLNADVEELIEFEGTTADQVLECLAVEKFHGDEGAAFVFTDVVDGADVWMIERGSGLGFALKASESLRISGDIFGE